VKRVLIVSLLLPLMMAVAIRSMYLVDRVEDNLLRMCQNVLDASEEENLDRLAAEVETLRTYWDTEEPFLRHYVRYAQVEALGISIARLSALTRSESAADLEAELLSIRWLIENIKHAEAFAWRNIL
jgi:hypothetical protein